MSAFQLKIPSTHLDIRFEDERNGPVTSID